MLKQSTFHPYIVNTLDLKEKMPTNILYYTDPSHPTIHSSQALKVLLEKQTDTEVTITHNKEASTTPPRPPDINIVNFHPNIASADRTLQTLGKKSQTPTITIFHEVERVTTEQKPYLIRTLKHSQYAIFSTNTDQQKAMALCEKQYIEKPKSCVIPRYYPYEHINPEPAERNPNNIVLLGEISPTKGLDIIAEKIGTILTNTNQAKSTKQHLTATIAGYVSPHTKHIELAQKLQETLGKHPDITLNIAGPELENSRVPPSDFDMVLLMKQAGACLIINTNDVFSPRSTTALSAFANSTPVIVLGDQKESEEKFPELKGTALFIQTLDDLPPTMETLQTNHELRASLIKAGQQRSQTTSQDQYRTTFLDFINQVTEEYEQKKGGHKK